MTLESGGGPPKLTDKRCKEIDDLTAKKEAELMAV